jgi:hypothetical protein
VTQWIWAYAPAAEGNAVLFQDVNGYDPDPDYLGFHGGLSRIDLDECYWQRCPLGMAPTQFVDFVDTLRVALLQDGLTLANCDVRLKGSSANFYSSWHKLMPYHRDFLRDRFHADWGWHPSLQELQDIDTEMQRAFPNPDLRPIRRPFDSLTRIGVSPPVNDYLSDYDVQVSSVEIERKVIAEASKQGKPPIAQPQYGFYDKKIVDKVCHQLQTQWPSSQSNKLRRGVNVKTFSANGPQNTTARIGHLSSHFRPLGPGGDWRII